MQGADRIVFWWRCLRRSSIIWSAGSGEFLFFEDLSGHAVSIRFAINFGIGFGVKLKEVGNKGTKPTDEVCVYGKRSIPLHQPSCARGLVGVAGSAVWFGW